MDCHFSGLEIENLPLLRNDKLDHQIIINGATISLETGDLTEQVTDAIVNAANPGLMGGGGVDGAIHRAVGLAILEECKIIVARHGFLPTGKAVITTGGNLKAKFVIHTVGPVWHGGNSNEPAFLASAYRESLTLASERNLHSIAFPSISAGAYGYPVQAAAKVAISTVIQFLAETNTSLQHVVFVLFSNEAYETYAASLSAANGHEPA